MLFPKVLKATMLFMKHLTKLCIFDTASPLPDAVIALVSFFLRK